MYISAAKPGVTPQPLNGGSAEPVSAFFPILVYFRANNAEGLRIRKRLMDALALAKSTTPQAAAVALDEAQLIICTEIGEARRRASQTEHLLADDAETQAWYARELVQVADSWDDLDRIWPSDIPAAEPLAAKVARAKRSIPVLDSLIFTCAVMAIPNDLDNHLKNYRIGKSLDFVSIFRDQLPSDDKTREVLAVLAPQSGVVSGLIDLGKAQVIKADQRFWRQALSVFIVLLAAALGFGLIGIAVHLGDWFHFNPAEWRLKPDQETVLSGAYLLVLLGVLGHWVLDRVKQNRAGTDVTPLAEWLMWIHINEVPITIRIVTVWLVVGLGVGFQTYDFSKGVPAMACFTAGYFLDSTFDALVGRFNTFVGGKDPAKGKAQKTSG